MSSLPREPLCLTYPSIHPTLPLILTLTLTVNISHNHWPLCLMWQVSSYSFFSLPPNSPGLEALATLTPQDSQHPAKIIPRQHSALSYDIRCSIPRYHNSP